MITLTFRAATAGFFDRPKVYNSISRAEKRVYSKAGAFVRRRAQTSIRYRNRPSTPGTPPSAHRTMPRTKTNRRTGVVKRQMVSPLREFIFFSWDTSSRTTVIGPVLLNGKAGARCLTALEYGGAATVFRHRGRTVNVRVRPRPFMRPALTSVLPLIPTFWHNALR